MLIADESMDLDPNYDPSDFLPTNSQNIDSDKDLTGSSNPNHTTANIQDDLEISDSDEELARDPQEDTMEIKTEGDLGELWF